MVSIVNAYYMDWFVYPVNAVRASHSAVDLRICTDAANLCGMCIEELVRGVDENICFEKIRCLNRYI